MLHSTWHQICYNNANVRNRPIHFSFAVVLPCYCACCSVSLSTGNDAETPDAHSEAAFKPMFGKGWALMIRLSLSCSKKRSNISIFNVILKCFFFLVRFYIFLLQHLFIPSLYCLLQEWILIPTRRGQPEMLSWALKWDIAEIFICANLANGFIQRNARAQNNPP